MDETNREKLLKTLNKQLKSTDGVTKQSVQHKIDILMDYNKYKSTSTLLSASTINDLMFAETLLLDGCKNILQAEPVNNEAEERLKFIENKIYFLKLAQKEAEAACTPHTRLEKHGGFLILDSLGFELDPLNEADTLCILLDRHETARLKLSENVPSIKIEMTCSKLFEIILIKKETNSIYGLISIPTAFFVEFNGKEVSFILESYNILNTKISFERYRQITLLPECKNILVLKGHPLVKTSGFPPFYCFVCNKLCPISSESYFCIYCNLKAHLNCSHQILYKCVGRAPETKLSGDVEKALKKLNSENEAILILDKNDEVERCAESGVIKDKLLENTENTGFRHRCDTMHSLKPEDPKGNEYCRHCGERIDLLATMLSCEECKAKFHKECEKLICGTCKSAPVAKEKIVDSMLETNIFSDSTHKIVDFEIQAFLGRGSYGKVLLGKNKINGEKIAIKVLKKHMYNTYEKLRLISNEKRVLRLIGTGNCPFVASFKYFFYDKRYVFFGTEYCGGGNMLFHLATKTFTEAQVHFYSTEIILALEFLHSKNIIVGDLKLNNILLAANGHIKISDFGLSQVLPEGESIIRKFHGGIFGLAPEVLEYGEFSQ
ncbi:putative protein kinase C delta type, partial [Enteropsectra breve]